MCTTESQCKAPFSISLFYFRVLTQSFVRSTMRLSSVRETRRTLSSLLSVLAAPPGPSKAASSFNSRWQFPGFASSLQKVPRDTVVIYTMVRTSRRPVSSSFLSSFSSSSLSSPLPLLISYSFSSLSFRLFSSFPAVSSLGTFSGKISRIRQSKAYDQGQGICAGKMWY